MKDAGTQSYIWAGVGGFFGFLTVQEWIAVISLMAAVTTTFVNSYYKKKDNERKERERERLEELHALRVKRMKLKLLRDSQVK